MVNKRISDGAVFSFHFRSSTPSFPHRTPPHRTAPHQSLPHRTLLHLTLDHFLCLFQRVDVAQASSGVHQLAGRIWKNILSTKIRQLSTYLSIESFLTASERPSTREPSAAVNWKITNSNNSDMLQTNRSCFWIFYNPQILKLRLWHRCGCLVESWNSPRRDLRLEAELLSQSDCFWQWKLTEPVDRLEWKRYFLYLINEF